MRDSLPPILLIVEESDEDFALLQRIVAETAIPCQIDRCISGDKALAYLEQTHHSGARPALIVLDLSLAEADGAAVLDRIKQTSLLLTVPIVVLSSSLNQKEVNALYQQGISGYIVKQADGENLKRNMQLLLEYWFIANQLPV